jgi:Tfp pilus assembly protein PilF
MNYSKKIGFFYIIAVLALWEASCGTGAAIQETPLPAAEWRPSAEPVSVRPSEGGIVDEIRSAAELGIPSSLQNGLSLIRDRGLGSNDFGRVMNAVISTLIQKLYPNPGLRLSVSLSDLPQTSPYTRILRGIAAGIYLEPQANSQDYLEYTLPFLALLESADQQKLLNTLPFLERAQELNPRSVLALYFMGLVYERMNRFSEAISAYRRAYTVSSECYPAALGLVRLMNEAGQKQEALWILQDLVVQFPDNMTVKRELALAYYRNKAWSQAEPAIQESLQRNSRDSEFILMMAHTLVERKQFLRAVTFLDQYAVSDTANTLYLFLRARIQAEGYHNFGAALNYLRSMLNRPRIDDEIAVYAAGLLLESSQAEDQQEGRELLRRLIQAPAPPLSVIEIAFQDAVRREAWAEAKSYLPRLLNEGLPSQSLLRAYTVERGLGNKTGALGYAKELHEREPSNDEATVAYISALIDLGQSGEAGTLIESRLASLNGGVLKAQYYYLRSRLQRDEEGVLQDLRTCLFEDPRNFDALLGMVEVYAARRSSPRRR